MTEHTPGAPFVSVAPKLGFAKPLDGLRGFGIMIVVLGHATVDKVQGFTSIIDGFFLLSGFLIVTLLLQEHRSTGTISLKKFYSRRAVRLLPSLWVNLLFWILVGVVTQIAGKNYLKDILKNAAAAFFYVYHLFFPVGSELISVTKEGHEAERIMSILWTLSIEEHFYIVIPITVLVFVKRNWVKQLAVLLAGIWLAISIHRFLGYTGPIMDPDAPAVLRLFWLARPESLVLGCLLALVNAHIPEEFTTRHAKRFQAMGGIFLVLWLLSMQMSHILIRDHVSESLYAPFYPPDGSLDSYGSGPVDDQMYWFRFGHVAGQLTAFMVVIPWVRYPDWWGSKIMSIKPFTWLGRLSYTLYIWHAVPIVIMEIVAPDLHWTLNVVAVGILSVLISIPIYYLIELRVMGAKLKYSAEKESLDLRTGTMVRTDGTPAAGSATAETPGRSDPPRSE